MKLILAELSIEISVTQWPKIEGLGFCSSSSCKESKHTFLYAIFSCQNFYQKIAEKKWFSKAAAFLTRIPSV